jgi:cytidyltransferase-like protein
MIFYADMVADLYHFGHSEYIKNIYLQKKDNDLVYIGIHNDEVVESYKRTPILTMEERIKVIESCKYIDKIIPNAPLKVTKEYIDLHKIDYIFIPNNRTDEEICIMYEIPFKLGMIKTIPYTNTISSTEIIDRIIKRYK